MSVSYLQPTAPPEEVAVGTRLTAEQQAVVASNLRLISVVVKRGRPDYDDAWQNGVLGLARAAQKFDPARGIQFSTYAMWWIRQAVQKGGRIESPHGFTNTNRAAERGATLPALIALDAPIGEDGASTFGELLPADLDAEADAIDRLAMAELVARLERCAKDDIDRTIIAAHLARRPPTLTDLAAKTGLSRQGIRNRRDRLASRAHHPAFRRSRPVPDLTPIGVAEPTTTLTCPDCGRNGFATPQAVGAHRRHEHPGAAGRQSRPRPRPERQPDPEPTPAPAPTEDTDPWLVLVGDFTGDQPSVDTVVLPTRAYAIQVADLLVRLGHEPLAFRVADAKVPA